MEQKKGESSEDYLKRLFAEGDNTVKNLKKNKEDMKIEGVVGFCSECGASKYDKKIHNCK